MSFLKRITIIILYTSGKLINYANEVGLATATKDPITKRKNRCLYGNELLIFHLRGKNSTTTVGTGVFGSLKNIERIKTQKAELKPVTLPY